MAKSAAEQIAELRKEMSELRETNAVLLTRLEVFVKDFENLQTERKAEAAERQENARLRQEAAETRKLLEDERARGRERDRENNDIRAQLAALRQRSDDDTRRAEAWTNRIWGFFVVLIGAILSLASGLIVTLARK
jgi:hypothetical protein